MAGGGENGRPPPPTTIWPVTHFFCKGIIWNNLALKNLKFIRASPRDTILLRKVAIWGLCASHNLVLIRDLRSSYATATVNLINLKPNNYYLSEWSHCTQQKIELQLHNFMHILRWRHCILWPLGHWRFWVPSGLYSSSNKLLFLVQNDQSTCSQCKLATFVWRVSLTLIIIDYYSFRSQTRSRTDNSSAMFWELVFQ